MSGRCEICQKPIAARCSGLDVDALGFCADHAKEHEKDCLEILRGAAQIDWIEAKAGTR